jgi:hypothetical protein
MMTFRVEDLTVSLLPDGYGIEDAAAKCTKCTKRTGPPTECSDPSEQGCECVCQKATNSPTKKRSLNESEIAMLHAQIDELLASL